MNYLSSLEGKRVKVQSNDGVDSTNAVDLIDKLLYLKTKRESLQRQLEYLQKMEEGNVSGVEESEDEDVKEATSHREFLEQIQGACRLTGVSVYSRTGGSLILTFDTGYKGEYFGPHYLELLKKKTGGIALAHHSLPCFLPVSKLAKDCLQVDITSVKAFVDKISDLLYAYVCRREEVNASKRLHGDDLAVNSTDSFDRMELTLQCNGEKRLKLFLAYKDLLDVLPSDVEIHLSKEFPSTSHEALTEDLTQKLELLPLSDALKSIEEYIDSST